jgi:hypothetical protein
MALIPGEGRFEPVMSVAPFAALPYADILQCSSWFALECDRGPAGLRAREMVRAVPSSSQSMHASGLSPTGRGRRESPVFFGGVSLSFGSGSAGTR